ncbi:signal recognition particle-docking protein FtsY, partial [Microbacteriaceae bacterium K1510]|nr:signal recognition particle-docking protein FtsY [Microbacteriaceae bacterium K1510]
MFNQQGKKVLLAAGDTFRAAAIEQLEVWGQRVGVDVIKQQQGADPAAVIFDAVQAAKSRGVDILLCDTAGRLQNKVNLMEELNKVYRVLQREIPGAPHEVLLVLDATTGQNALSQAKTFEQSAGVTGIVLTKLDG